MNTLRRILKLVDFGDTDETAFADALTLARKFDAQLHMLHVVAVQGFPRFGSNARLQNAESQREEFMSRIDDVEIFREIRQGDIVDCVVAYVQEFQVDMLVIDRRLGTIKTKRAFKSLIGRLMDRLSIPLVVVSSESDGDTESARQAIESLQRRWGESLVGEFDQSLNEMQAAIAADLNTSDQEAATIIQRLQVNESLVWKSADEDGGGDSEGSTRGSWEIVVPDNSAPVFAANEAENATSAAISLLQRAIEVRATDVHIDPMPDHGYGVRFRIDGRMEDFCTMRGDVAGTTMKQIKLLANVSLADPFHSTESRLELNDVIPDFEVRITTAPVAMGEAIALRLIDRDKLYRPLNELGMSTNAFTAIYRMLHQRTGLVLITGPTGAGKTTTAYSILNVLFSEKQNIISIENPVELLVPFMRQLNVDLRHDFTMAHGLSTILRMDPDVVFIGEIRGSEAAHVSMRAATCGKRAFSTIHMRDVATTITAMREFDIDALSLSENLAGVIAQRLVRRICQDCCERSPATKHEQEIFQSREMEPPAEVVRARGCSACRGTGYRGRVGVFEAMDVYGDLADAIRHQKTEAELRALIRANGASLADDALAKVCEGITTVEEVQELSWLAEALPMTKPEAPSASIYERGVPYKPESIS